MKTSILPVLSLFLILVSLQLHASNAVVVGCPDSCEDLSTDCRLSSCSSDHEKVWCAKTCKTCPLRDKCYNADGDKDCAKYADMGMCITTNVTKVVCKKACTGCKVDSPPTPCPTPPPCTSCEDLTTDCRLSDCSTEHAKVWCAKKCNSCSLRDKCYNADGDTNCNKWADMGMCKTAPFTNVICKKACMQCTADSPSNPCPTPPAPTTPPPTPCTLSCDDLSTDCHLSDCSTDHQKVWCANTCNTCSYRYKCYNADGDVNCTDWQSRGMCLTAPNTNYICKKACSQCTEDTPLPSCSTSAPPPTTTSPCINNCQDLTTDCHLSSCSNDYQKVWCAKKCNACPLRDRCYNAAGDDNCTRWADMGMCITAPFTNVICKKACTLCTVDSAPSACTPQTTPSSCQDLTTDCRLSECSNDYQKLWCARKCNSCSMRDICYNGAGDSDCATYADMGMCASAPNTNVICKKACKKC